MRKITSLFALLLLFVLGVQAQQTVDGTHVYTISTADRGSWVVPNGETAIWSTTKANLTPLATDTKQQFAFVTVSGTQYLYSVSAKKFVSKNGNYTKLGWTGDPVSIIASSGDTDHPSVVVLNGSYQLGVSNNYDYGVISFWNDVSDAGNRVTIEAVDGVTFDDTEAQEVFSTGATTIAQTQALLDNTGVFTLQSKYGVSGSDKIYTESSDASEGNIPALLDNSYSTFHHSDWHGTAATPHWLTYELPDAADAVRFYIKQRNNGTGRPTNVTVSGSNDNNTFTEITTVSPSWDGSPLDTYSEAISASESYKYWRFTVNATNSTTNSWFCASEWYVLPNNAAVDAFFSTANTLRNPSATVSDINDAYTTAQTIETLLGSNTITYTAYNLLDNSEISSGSENVAGTFTAPAISGYAYQRATDASDNAVDLTTQTYNANTTLKLYYAPMLTDMSAVSATGVYTITTQGRGSWYDDGTQGYGGSTVGQYAFVTYAGNTYIYSTTSNKFMCHQMSSGVNQNNNRIQMQDTDLALLATGFTLAATGDITYPVSMSDANTYMFNVGGAGQLVLNTWKTLDTGNRLQIVQVANNFDATDALAALNTYFNGNYYDEVEAEVIPYLMDGQGNLSPTIGTPFGLSTSAATSIVSTYMTQLNNQQFTLEEYQAIVAAKDAGILYPEDGYYRVKNVSTGNYLRAISLGDRGGVVADLDATAAASDAASVIEIRTVEGKQYMLSNGGWFNWVYPANGYEGYVVNGKDKYVHWLVKAPGQGAFSIALGNGEGDYASYLNSGYYKVQDDNTTIGSDGSGDAASWIFESATQFTIALNAAPDNVNYATLAVPFDVTLPATVTAYTMAVNEADSQAKGTNLGQSVPAGTAVLLKSDTETSATATITSGLEAFTGTNSLKSNYFSMDQLADNQLALGVAEGEVGFYKYNYTLKANRAYLEVPTGSASRSFVITFDDDVTGISAVNASVLNGAAVYDLQGRRVNNAAKGVYIVNGKKVLVK